jgi:outer membrane receptor for ferrienterochelin and colicin
MSVVAPVWGQSNTVGYVTGAVDSSAGPVSGATVRARNLDTGLSRSDQTDSTGSYRISALPVGNYEVSVSGSGIESRSVETTVNVGEGTNINLLVAAAGEVLEEIVTTAKSVETLNMTQTETTTVITTQDIGRLPIPRDPNAVALLAPGAVYGDQAFGNDANATAQHYGTGFGLASLGGASVGENVYYINGMNVTNFRNGLGGSTIPFQFYDQFQIKSGGYSAEFGRSTGGVVNAATKRGTNEWQFGVGVNFEPESLREHSPDVADPTNPDEFDSVYSLDERDETEIFVEVGGPIIRDKLFVYGIYQARDLEIDNFTGGSSYRKEVDDDPFWGAKLDWYITDDHQVEYTGFSDERQRVRTTFQWDEATNTIGTNQGDTIIDRGGATHIFKYSGNFGGNFSASVLYGTSEYDLTTQAPADSVCPLAYDSRQGGLTQIGCWTNSIPAVADDEREIIRLDFEAAIGDNHLLRFGMDSEENTSTNTDGYSGPNQDYYRYFAATPGETLNNGGVVPAGVTEITRYRVLRRGGTFVTDTTAFYIEDEWTLNDTMTLRLGIRNEQFDNQNADDESFIKITDQYAPRIGFSWDVKGDGSSKLFANFGRYHLPIASNTNIRLSGAELFTEEWFVLDAPIDPTLGSTVLGAQIGPTSFFGDGSIPDVRETIDLGIEPMYQDEFILGYEQEFGDWIGSITYTFRELGEGIEDLTIDEALASPGLFHYILANPGADVRTFFDCEPRDIDGLCDGDGELEEYNFTGEELGFPAAERNYHAVTLAAEKVWNGEYYLKAQYTWSHSYGNYEGMVRSDNGQDDAGITTLYDFAGLLDGAKGNLPNDRRHVAKVWGAWEFAEGWQASGSFQYQSGRPKNAFGVHPTDPFSQLYGAESFFNQGVPVQRGSLGTTDSIINIDAGLKYTADIGNGTFIARLDVFNLFDFDDVTEVDELADEESGVAAPTFGLPLRFQRPRTVRFGLEYNF